MTIAAKLKITLVVVAPFAKHLVTLFQMLETAIMSWTLSCLTEETTISSSSHLFKSHANWIPFKLWKWLCPFFQRWKKFYSFHLFRAIQFLNFLKPRQARKCFMLKKMSGIRKQPKALIPKIKTTWRLSKEKCEH